MTNRTYSLAAVAFLSILLMGTSAWARVGATCVNCDNFGGVWDCKPGGVFGGTMCEVTYDQEGGSSCTVSGDCNGSSSIAHGGLTDIVLAVAEAHPRVAFALLNHSKNNELSSLTRTYTDDYALSAEDVVKLVDGVALSPRQTYQSAVVYESTLEADQPIAGLSTLKLVIRPIQLGFDDAGFEQFSLRLVENPSAGVFLPVAWSLK